LMASTVPAGSDSNKNMELRSVVGYLAGNAHRSRRPFCRLKATRCVASVLNRLKTVVWHVGK
ncbi:MAG: hypothetical protein KAX55_19365, partial [Propionivibrio sp.]|nr:hypothetical protein [Propionivibrio sp.]